MQIRKIKKDDVHIVSEICMNAFMDSVAPSLSLEGVESFTRIASVSGILNRMEGNNTILVCEKAGIIQGVVELSDDDHLGMLFVSPDVQKVGVGKALISAIIPYVKGRKVSVKASLNSVPAYLRYGFICFGKPNEKSGLKYQSMEYEPSKDL